MCTYFRCLQVMFSSSHGSLAVLLQKFQISIRISLFNTKKRAQIINLPSKVVFE